jgi:hypothetical protein
MAELLTDDDIFGRPSARLLTDEDIFGSAPADVGVTALEPTRAAPRIRTDQLPFDNDMPQEPAAPNGLGMPPRMADPAEQSRTASLQEQLVMFERRRDDPRLPRNERLIAAENVKAIQEQIDLALSRGPAAPLSGFDPNSLPGDMGTPPDEIPFDPRAMPRSLIDQARQNPEAVAAQPAPAAPQAPVQRGPIPPQAMPENPMLQTAGPGAGGGMTELYDQGILPRRYVEDPFARPELRNANVEAATQRLRGEDLITQPATDPTAALTGALPSLRTARDIGVLGAGGAVEGTGLAAEGLGRVVAGAEPIPAGRAQPDRPGNRHCERSSKSGGPSVAARRRSVAGRRQDVAGPDQRAHRASHARHPIQRRVFPPGDMERGRRSVRSWRRGPIGRGSRQPCPRRSGRSVLDRRWRSCRRLAGRAVGTG